MYDDEAGPEPPEGTRTPPNRRYWAAVGAVIVMTVLNFPFWLGGAVEPVIGGLPIAFTYHLLYALVAVVVLRFVFTAIWPRDDEAGSGATTRRDDETTRT